MKLILNPKPCKFAIICLLELIICLWLNTKLLQIDFVDSGPECKFQPDPISWNVPKYLGDDSPPSCIAMFPSLVHQNGNTIYRLRDTFINTSALDCHYTPFHGKNLDDYKLGNEGVTLGEEAVVNHELVKVNCSYKDEPVLENYFALFPDITSKVEAPEFGYNVLLLGIRSLSRFNLHRYMPMTLQLLRRNWQAVDFIKYHAIGREMLDNMAPLLTGLDVETFNKTQPNRHFIWDDYSSKGYETIFAEDCTPNGLFSDDFFKQKPTDHFWSPFSKISIQNTGNAKTKQCYRCLGNKMSYQRLLEYVENAALIFNSKESPYFGLFWINSLTTSGHSAQDLNFIGTLDFEFKKFFERLYRIASDDTVLVFFSDTGYIQDDQGRSDDLALGEYQPFFLFGFPSRFNTFHEFEYANIRGNRDKLITAYDLHKTLEDLADFDEFRLRYVSHKYKSGAESLLNDMPKRMCNRVGIRKDCACEFSENYFHEFFLY